jgi:hypothetical protein
VIPGFESFVTAILTTMVIYQPRSPITSGIAGTTSVPTSLVHDRALTDNECVHHTRAYNTSANGASK